MNCKVRGCSRTSGGLLCRSHQARAKRGQPLQGAFRKRRAPLTGEEKEGMRERYARGGISMEQLARELRVGISSVWHALNYVRCTFPGCTRNVSARGLCGGHYEQRRKGQVMRPLYRKTAEPKLTAEDVSAIRERYSRGKETQAEIAADYGVVQSTISWAILHRSDVPGATGASDD